MGKPNKMRKKKAIEIEQDINNLCNRLSDSKILTSHRAFFYYGQHTTDVISAKWKVVSRGSEEMVDIIYDTKRRPHYFLEKFKMDDKRGKFDDKMYDLKSDWDVDGVEQILKKVYNV